MKLHYRGAEYEASDSVIETVDTHLVGQYRGGTIHVRAPKQPIAKRAVGGLKYRGVPIN
jgi:hypothetical protein